VSLCRHLNEEQARYLVVGGMAVIHAGFVRATEDIDLLIDPCPDNVARVRRALSSLPDQAVREVGDEDIERYAVVRVADEIVVDLMKAACGIEYQEAIREAAVVELHSVPIPFARPGLLLRMKQTEREKDRLDRMFLERLTSEDRG
jgi:hypothetical protein